MTDENVSWDGPSWGEEPQAEPEQPQPPANVVALPAVPGPDDPDVRANHLYTISFEPGNKPPMVVVRGDSAAQIRSLLQELSTGGVFAAIGNALAEFRTHGAVGAGLGPTTPVPPQAPPAPAAQAQQWQAGPPVPSPGQPPFGGAPQGWQNPAPANGWGGQQAAPAAAAPVAVPQGWYQVHVPYPQKGDFDMIKPNIPRGELKWDKANKRWLVSPTYAGMLARWNPSPA